MAENETSEGADVRVAAPQTAAIVSAMFREAGLPAADAELVADTLVQADLRGVHSHGLIRVPYYIQRLRDGGTGVTPDVRITREGPAFAVIDGDNGMGQVVAAIAMRTAIAKARTAGVGWVVCGGSNHFGTAAYWAMQALPARMIGYAATNALPSLFAWGGTRGIVGNNPVAYAIPAGRHAPLVLDMAMSTVAHGKVAVLQAKGQPIPEGWLLDPQGRPTTDPDARAKGGAMTAIGGPKGVGLALVIDALSGVLGDAMFAGSFPAHSLTTAFGTAANQRVDVAHHFMAIDVDQFTPYDAFVERLDRLIDAVHESPRAAGVERVYAPGEIEDALRTARLADGIPLPPTVVTDLISTGRELGVEVGPLEAAASDD